MSDIAFVLESYGATVPETWGGWKAMKCPFHSDRNASAQMDDKGFRCLACDIFYPSAIALLMDRERLTFDNAKQRLETIVGASNGGVSNPSRPGSFLPGKSRNRNYDGSFLTSRGLR